MNPQWFGDSFDIVKRFFAEVLRELDYEIFVDPMSTGDWSELETRFLTFLGVQHIRDVKDTQRSALLLDPDTGIGKRETKKHTSIQRIITELGNHNIVFAFDQSFSRGRPSLPQMREKLEHVQSLGAFAFFYDSHARFLFASRSRQDLDSVVGQLIAVGLPSTRIVRLEE
ncbi:MAG: hypothetical protein R3284_04300 [Rubricoccaceae bacterium]|nr:hypothetical protein [Rubricoccaceae bacterium]